MAKKKSSVNNKSSSNENKDFSFDVSKILTFFKSLSSAKWSKILIVLAILVPMFLSIWFRLYPLYLPVTDDWAYNNIYNSVRSQVSAQINQQYPNLPAPNKDQMINDQVSQFLATQGPGLEQQINSISRDLKARFQDDTGQTYLLAIDPYLWLRYSRNIVENGHIGDEIRDGQSWDNHMIAPLGKTVANSFHPWFQANLHKFLRLFGQDNIMKTAFFVPIIISALSVVPAFFIARRKAGDFAGFVAATIVAVHGAFLGRTAGGFADTDAYNVFFPLIIAWLFIEAFETKDVKRKYGLIALSGLFVGLFSYAWSGWWYVFDMLLGVIVIHIIFVGLQSIIQNKSAKYVWNSTFKNSVFSAIAFFAASGIFVTIFSGWESFYASIRGPISFLLIKQAAKADLWPNVYTTVAELNAASINTIIKQIGGKLLFFIAAMGVAVTMIKQSEINKKDYLFIGTSALVFLLLVTDKFITFSTINYLLIFSIPLVLGLLLLLNDRRDIDVKYALFLTIWFAGTIFASTRGTRFTLLLVPAFAIAFGIALGTFEKYLTRLVTKEFSFNKKIVSSVLIVLLALLLIAPVKSADQVAKSEIPSMSDAWYNSLTKINEQAAPDAIITSWWDFGHWFKAIADRAVTFDGGTQNRPQAHWVGKSLMTSSEKESLDILRMLDCGGNTAFDLINEKLQDTEISVRLTYELISLDRESGVNLLSENGFTDDEINAIIDRSHCTPPEAYFITSGDMVGKAGVWAHFGSWNFEKSYAYNNVKGKSLEESVQLLKERFDYSDAEATTMYMEVQSLTNDQAVNNWIAPWPNYGTASWRGCTPRAEVVQCGVGISVGQSNQGQNVQISHAIINVSNPNATKFVLSFIDRNTGLSVGNQQTEPNGIVISTNDSFERTYVGGDIFLDVVYDEVQNRAIVAHPDLSQSMFTRLFFLEGAHTENFELFSDETAISGTRILIWKVDWNS